MATGRKVKTVWAEFRQLKLGRYQDAKVFFCPQHSFDFPLILITFFDVQAFDVPFFDVMYADLHLHRNTFDVLYFQ